MNEWRENENFSNASPFLHMQGPFVPNFSEIGQLVKKVPLGGTWTPPWGGRGRKFEKLKKTSRGNASRNMYAKFCDDRTIFSHLKIGGTESGTYIPEIVPYQKLFVAYQCTFAKFGANNNLNRWINNLGPFILNFIKTGQLIRKNPLQTKIMRYPAG